VEHGQRFVATETGGLAAGKDGTKRGARRDG